ncbi:MULTISPECIES: BPSS1780 family membrane protein [unclassified Massilia]|uniref:BPSS1780 family membrane protein n=1 Tax=unclassified Massilia TaxID=2609279 RepID=UPI001E4588E5|nr:MULTISPECIES: BPSS1780 family membrane protein [unclassified Massilia]
MPAITGWNWLKEGTGLFRKQPAALTTLLFANILFSLFISAVPFFGKLMVVLIPSLSMAFMKACLMIENGERVTPAVLLTGFKKPVLGPLCKVGLIYLAASLVLSLLTKVAIDPAFWEQMAKASQSAQPVDPANAPQVQASDMLAMLGIFILDVAVLVALAFAAPLTYWQHMGPGKAAFYSFFAVLKSARVFIVLLMSWFALFTGVCFIIALLLGGSSLARVAIMWLFFLFVLLLQCAMYAGYRQIFGKPVEAPGGRVNLSK